MFRLDQQVLNSLAGQGGGPFTNFVDDLIQTEAYLSGVNMDSFHKQLRVNISDGGVDTSLDLAASDSPVGWLSHPTCWQYKAEQGYDTTKILSKLAGEMKKHYSSELIRQGYAYRFCILADVEEVATKKIEAKMLEIAMEIWDELPGQPEIPRLVDGADLQNWAKLRPASVLSLTKQHGEFSSLWPWVENQRQVTPEYVANPEAKALADSIVYHVDFRSQIASSEVCYKLTGHSGVGKTRMVSETLAEIDGLAPLIVQTANDIEARKLAAYAAEDPRVKMVLVADECDVDAVNRLENLLGACSHRVRVVAIEHLDRVALGVTDPESWLDKLPPATASSILEKNFPDVPDSLRALIIRLTDGYIRFAALVCKDASYSGPRAVQQTLRSVETALERYLQDDLDREIVGVISLFLRVGYRDDVRSDLERISKITGIDVRTIERQVDTIRQRTGFISQEGRYWYVTPQVVARCMFQWGYQAFARNDLHQFIQHLSADMLKQFQTRAELYGGTEVAAEVANYFRGMMRSLDVASLADAEVAELAVSVTKLNPDQYLHPLAQLIENASQQELLRIRGYSHSHAARRHLVWMFESFALFEKYFDDSERSLFALARAENEQQIGNSASKVWAKLFQIRTANTEVPFEKRLEKLAPRLNPSTPLELIQLVADAILNRQSGNVVPPEYYAGMEVPARWRPESDDEERQCLEMALNQIVDSMKTHSEISDTLFQVVLESLFWLIQRGLICQLRSLFSHELLDVRRKQRLHNALTDLMRIHYQPGQTHVSPVSSEPIEDWINELAPSGFSEQLHSVLSCDLWHERFFPEMEGKPGEIGELVEQVLRNPELLDEELSWLNSAEALAARRFGIRLGKEDVKRSFAEQIAKSVADSENLEFITGYVSSLAMQQQPLPEVLIDCINQVVQSTPREAIQLIEVAGDKANGFDTILKLIEDHRVGAVDLIRIAHSFGGRVLSEGQFQTLLSRLLDAEPCDAAQGVWLVKLIHHYQLVSSRNSDGASIFDSPESTSAILNVLRMSMSELDSRFVGEWNELVKQTIASGNEQAFGLLEEALGSSNLTLVRLAIQSLRDSAANWPDQTMKTFGAAITHPANVYFRVDVCDDLLESLPTNVVLNWCQGKSEQAISILARHLPPPRQIDGALFVPKLLDAFLTEYGSDAVLAEFHAGKNSSTTWSGPLSPQLRDEARFLAPLTEHTNDWLKRWAVEEIQYLNEWASREQQREAEEAIEFRAG